MTAPSMLHYMPPAHWMNDPNGLVAHQGRYHLFFQHNPDDVTHGNMNWGHASSPDLFAWEHHPVAIASTDEEEIYSGSVVVDEDAVSGYGTAENPALIAFYTSVNRVTRMQAQSVAVSLDAGMTWTPHHDNPVLDRGSADFRDPKVLRWADEHDAHWVMVTVEAEEQEVHLFRSDNLITWTPLSIFGGRGALGGVWECPDLFPLAVEATGERLWVLLVSVISGAPAGGSGTQYFVGRFDGTTFTPLRRPDADRHRALWLDHGFDNYAGVTYFGLPEDERILVGWMSNWSYARELPPLRGALGMMTLPRRLLLVSDAGGCPILAQRPVLPGGLVWNDLDAGPASAAPQRIGPVAVLDVDVVAPPRGQACLRLRAHADGTGGVLVTVSEREVAVDRTAVAGNLPELAGVARAPRVRGSARTTLRIVLDEQSIEVFADEGTIVLTCRILPEPDAVGVQAEVSGNARIEAICVTVPT